MSIPDSPANEESVAALRQQYMQALSGFIGRLSLSRQSLQRISERLKGNQGAAVTQLLDQLALELNAKTPQKAASVSTSPIDQALMSLFEQLPYDQKRHHKIAELKKLLTVCTDETGQARFVSALGNLIIESIHNGDREKKIFEDYIEKLITHMQSMEHFVSNLQDDLKISHTNIKHLQGDLDIYMSAARLGTEKVHDFEKMRETVKTNIHKMDSSLSAFYKLEAARMRVGELRNREIFEDLEHIQKESILIKNQLDESNQTVAGAADKHAFTERLSIDFSRWQRSGKKLSLALIELDHVDEIIDKFGLKAYNRLLCLLVKLGSSRLNEKEFFAQLGEHQFVMLLPDSDAKEASLRTQEVRDQLSQAGFNYQGKPVRITLSHGISQFTDNDTPETTLARAERALIMAKQAAAKNKLL